MTQTTNCFNEASFNYTQRAQEEWEKREKKLSKIKKGLIVASLAQIDWIIILFFGPVGIIGHILEWLAVIGTVTAYIFGGGLVAALQSTWGVAKKIAVFGWLCTPFPVDILTGLLFSGIAMIYGCLGFLVLPLLIVFNNYRRVKKEQNAICDHVILNAPVNVV